MTETTARGCAAVCPCDEVCPIGSAIAKIGGRWKLRILCSLTVDGTMRFGDLQRKIRGITPAMLTTSLKEMEEDGLVIRTQYQEMPVRVEYQATTRARELWPILHRLAHWALDTPFDSDDEPIGQALAAEGETE